MADPPADVRSIDQLDFDSDAASPGCAFDQYRAFYGVGTDVVLTGPAMHAHVRGWQLDRMLMYERRLHDVGHRRNAARVTADGFNHFTVTVVLGGRVTLLRGDRTIVLHPGETMLLDTRQPGENRMDRAHIVTIAVARERLSAIAEDVATLDGLVLSPEAGRLFHEFVALLVRNLPTMTRSARMAAAGMLTMLLTVAIDDAGVKRQSGRAAEADRLAHLRQVVDAQLGDAGFDVAAMVRRSGLARATLYRVLALHGGVRAFIRGRRLDYLRRRLTDPGEARPFATLAAEAGFTSASEASRSFFKSYAVRPSDYRALVGAGSASGGVHLLRLWLDEVR